MFPYHLITVLIQISFLVFIMSIYIFGQMRTRQTHMGRRLRLFFFLLLFQLLRLLLPLFFLLSVVATCPDQIIVTILFPKFPTSLATKGGLTIPSGPKWKK